MDDISKVAEKLANAVMFNEAAGIAMGKAGFVKLAENAWLSPLVGAGLGAAGGGLAGYLSSPELEKEKDTLKRTLVGGLAGAGLGGAAGYGLDQLGKSVEPKGPVKGPGDKGPIPGPAVDQSISDAMNSSRIAIPGLGHDIKHPIATAAGFGMLGGNPFKKPEESLGLGQFMHNIGEKVQKLPSVMAKNEKEMLHQVLRRLGGPGKPGRFWEKPLEKPLDSMTSALSDVMSGKQKNEAKGRARPVTEPAGPQGDRSPGGIKNVFQKAKEEHAAARSWDNPNAGPQPDTTLDFLKPKKGGPRTPEEVEKATREAMTALGRKRTPPNVNLTHPQARAAMGLEPLTALSDEATPFEIFKKRLGATDSQLLAAAKGLPEGEAINAMGWRNPKFLGAVGQRTPQAIAATLLASPLLGEATSNWFANKR